jgi:hypothetical protein
LVRPRNVFQCIPFNRHKIIATLLGDEAIPLLLESTEFFNGEWHPTIVGQGLGIRSQITPKASEVAATLTASVK